MPFVVRTFERSSAARTTNDSFHVYCRRVTSMHFSRTRHAWFALSAAIVAAGVILPAEDWPEWRGRARTGVWNESGVIDTFPASGLPVRWRTPIHAGYAGPAIAGGRVFVTDSRRIKANQALERAIALDEQSGRVLWTHEWETNISRF